MFNHYFFCFLWCVLFVGCCFYVLFGGFVCILLLLLFRLRLRGHCVHEEDKGGEPELWEIDDDIESLTDSLVEQSTDWFACCCSSCPALPLSSFSWMGERSNARGQPTEPPRSLGTKGRHTRVCLFVCLFVC
jgi:hypothetical protein